eukprot:TRINITY_DN28251_c0_g1_i2.p1 TRINITY_DN28251_c0_g1~~TRINITY_DN28251_c0_g1_i2.p1  ORF type:complete len:328 (+),score=129.07 TRINITY_DN28251_c0_g1_i2:80-985(+)
MWRISRALRRHAGVLRAATAASAGTAAAAVYAARTAVAEEGGVVSDAPDYIGQIKVYNVGILEDPIKGAKRGKGSQVLNSSYWLEDLSCFIARELPRLKAILRHAKTLGQKKEGCDFMYLTNLANVQFMRAENTGLRTKRSLDYWLMGSWLAMAAAEVDTFEYSKYSRPERLQLRDRFYSLYEEADSCAAEPPGADVMGQYHAAAARVDLVPQVALERLGLHNELCELKYPDTADEWKRKGFNASRRISSAKRHFDGVHKRDKSEDHIAHLIWNFMAVYHVVKVFPHLNDLPDFSNPDGGK